MRSLIFCTFFLVPVAFTVGNSGFVTEVNQNYHSKINSQINQQITLEHQASYLYKTYASYFGRADVALKGFKKFFSDMSKEENDHADQLIEYVNSRGGSLQYSNIELTSVCNKIQDEVKRTKDDLTTRGSIREGYAPLDEREYPCICYFMSQKRDELKKDPICSMSNRDDWKNGLMAMEDALIMERYVNEELLALHKKAEHFGDAHLSHILEHPFIDEQVSSIKQFADYITRLRKFKNDYNMGEFLFDQKLQ
ncbi:yolk ferritin-like [Gigantopelta aegis]|uniref:yolk ferritin-like n=1 Tax=Gigantopelta aegis TaxID=1735272 RepID=UPI001B8873EF|nr:yolk ferritin-like [Gigantopelta aegis]